MPVAPARRIVSATSSGESPKPSLEVGRDRHLGRRGDRLRMRKRLVARQLAVLSAEDAGGGAARGRQRGEAELRQQRRRAGSKALAMTKARGPACSSRRRSALSAWERLMANDRIASWAGRASRCPRPCDRRSVVGLDGPVWRGIVSSPHGLRPRSLRRHRRPDLAKADAGAVPGLASWQAARRRPHPRRLAPGAHRRRLPRLDQGALRRSRRRQAPERRRVRPLRRPAPLPASRPLAAGDYARLKEWLASPSAALRRPTSSSCSSPPARTCSRSSAPSSARPA